MSRSDLATRPAGWFALRGIDAVWLTFRVGRANLETFLSAVRVLENLNGFTVTAPHKAALGPLLDQVSERARRIGAVNVVRRDGDGRLVGDNMEGLGLLKALETAGVGVRGTSVWLVEEPLFARARDIRHERVWCSWNRAVRQRPPNARPIVQAIRAVAGSENSPHRQKDQAAGPRDHVAIRAPPKAAITVPMCFPLYLRRSRSEWPWHEIRGSDSYRSGS